MASPLTPYLHNASTLRNVRCPCLPCVRVQQLEQSSIREATLVRPTPSHPRARHAAGDPGGNSRGGGGHKTVKMYLQHLEWDRKEYRKGNSIRQVRKILSPLHPEKKHINAAQCTNPLARPPGQKTGRSKTQESLPVDHRMISMFIPTTHPHQHPPT